MTDQKVTIMELKVDLQCPCCYRKIKKILCEFPQIRDQKYDEKQNTVTITVVCCNPEKIRCKLCCKGGKTIKSIEIIPPPKPEPPKPAPTPTTVCLTVCCGPCSECCIGGPCHQDHCRPTFCETCSKGVTGGPCCQDHGRPTCCGPCSGGVPGSPCYKFNYGCGPYGFCGSRGGRVYYTGRYDYFCEEYPPGCRII